MTIDGYSYAIGQTRQGLLDSKKYKDMDHINQKITTKQKAIQARNEISKDQRTSAMVCAMLTLLVLAGTLGVGLVLSHQPHFPYRNLVIFTNVFLGAATCVFLGLDFQSVKNILVNLKKEKEAKKNLDKYLNTPLTEKDVSMESVYLLQS